MPRPKRIVNYRQRPEGKTGWEVDYRDAHGRRVRVVVADEAAAIAKAAAVAEDLQKQSPVDLDDPDVTLRVYAERWLDGPQQVEPKTLASYKGLLTGHVLPTLGHVKLRDLHRRHVKALLQAKRTAGLAANTVRLIKASLSTVLSDAVDDGYVPVNVALGTGRRKGKAQAPAAAEQIGR
jgi:hypothetical protein